MMVSLAAVRDYIASLSITNDENVYMGKLDNKKKESIGVYNRKSEGPPIIALGGYDNTTYDVKHISLLLHWNKSPRDTEKKANELFEKLKTESNITIGESNISYLLLLVPEPQDIGTDETGIYEYVIWFDIIYNKRKEEKNE